MRATTKKRRGRKPGRNDGGEWLYGRRPVVEALRAGRRLIHELWLAEGGRRGGLDNELEEIHALAVKAGAVIKLVPREEFSDLLEGANHQGVALHTGAYPYGDLGQIIHIVRQNPQAVVLILDHLEDPQNVGSLLRTADAAGIAGVILPADRAAGVTAAAVRASAGAAEHMCVARVVNLTRAIKELKQEECWVTGLDVGPDARNYTAIDFKGRCALVVGNEGRGLKRLVREQCDFIAQLPMQGRISSLNAGVAGALVMYEVLRQRE